MSSVYPVYSRGLSQMVPRGLLPLSWWNCFIQVALFLCHMAQGCALMFRGWFILKPHLGPIFLMSSPERESNVTQSILLRSGLAKNSGIGKTAVNGVTYITVNKSFVNWKWAVDRGTVLRGGGVRSCTHHSLMIHCLMLFAKTKSITRFYHYKHTTKAGLLFQVCFQFIDFF